MQQLRIEGGKTISSQIYDHLRRQIIENRLQPNTRLSEASLCADFGVSRQPVREVLLRLSSDKLVTIHPQRGTLVSPISLNLFYSAQLIREAVEVEVIGRVCATLDPRLLLRLREELDLQETFCDHDDPVRFFQSDETFHSRIADACGIATLWGEILDHKIHLDRVRHLSLVTAETMTPLIADHLAIFEALRSRDPVAARTAMQHHLRRVLRQIERLQSARPEWFME